MNNREIFEKLSAPFDDSDHEWLTQKQFQNRGTHIVVPYIRKPSIIKRLNNVLGFGNFAITVKNLYSEQFGEDKFASAFIAELKLKVNDEWITFSDAGVNIAFKRDTADKGASTDAIKRAAKLAGIGIYLDMGKLSILIPIDSVDPKIAFFDGRTVTLHPSLVIPFGSSKGKAIEDVSQDTRSKLYEWLNKEDRYKKDEYLFRLRETIRKYFLEDSK